MKNAIKTQKIKKQLENVIKARIEVKLTLKQISKRLTCFPSLHEPKLEKKLRKNS